MLLRRHNDNRLQSKDKKASIQNKKQKKVEKSTNKKNHSNLDWHELRKYAIDEGINIQGLKRKEIEALLEEGEK